MSKQARIHFAHANGVPSLVYEKILNGLRADFDVVTLPLIGTDPRYPVSNHWPHLVDQLIDSVLQQNAGQKVIGLGHSLGSVLTLMAAYKRPELFHQVIMLDPPLILGRYSFAFHMAKLLSPKTVDKMTPAGLSAKRRDHWDSREQAYELLRNKGFYRGFDDDCFKAYIAHALCPDPVRGGVTLTIPKAVEVAIFRTNPSWWWLSLRKKVPVPVDLWVGEDSLFYQRGFPEIAQKSLGIPYQVVQGGHMFPLEHPLQAIEYVRQSIAKHSND